MADSVDSIEGALDWLPKRFHSVAAADVSAVYLVELAGPGGGAFWLRIDDGRLSVGEGRTPAPDVVLRAAAPDFYGFLAGRENPDLLYMEERIVVEGSLSLALKLRVIFSASASS
ncbi:MAG: hypothetical protein CL908_18155 [Deltaproteobacteria bacterium]|jgi:predicted lipid carrier protein YhbT|nr:hypothetical protein [Deltaproteobacteria bacterium]